MSLTPAEQKLLALRERWHEVTLRLCSAWQRSKDTIVISRTEKGWPKEEAAEVARQLYFGFCFTEDVARNLLFFADRCVELGRIPQGRFAVVYLFTPKGFVERFEPRECGPCPLTKWSDLYYYGPEPKVLDGPDALLPLVQHSEIAPQRLRDHLCDEISKIAEEKAAELDQQNK